MLALLYMLLSPWKHNGCHSICVPTSTTVHLLISYGASAVDYFIPFLYRLQRGVGLTQKVDYPVYGLMRAQTFDNMVSGKSFHSARRIFNLRNSISFLCARITMTIQVD